MKRAVLNMMRLTGAFAMLRLLNRNRALILTYHRFSRKNDGVSTSAAAFSEQLAYLNAHYRVVPLPQLVELVRGGGTFPERLAAITIDDGYRDAYEIAFPLLRRYGMPATLYVVTQFVEGRLWLWTDKIRFLLSQTGSPELRVKIKGRERLLAIKGEGSRRAAAETINGDLKQLSDEEKDQTINEIAASLRIRIPETPPAQFDAINWDQAREMADAGIEIGSHTVTHPILTNISDEHLQLELSQSRAQIEAQLKRRIDHFCYPNGDFDSRVREAAARAGYGSAVTCLRGMNLSGADPLTLRRVHTESDLTHFEQSTSGFEDLKLKVRTIFEQ